ncbi:hypothetical protein [Paenibacillus sp. NPDC057967]|uniref:phage tail assembly chaperone n=1 Tax=Paenibacillus sp. NPDC057967 TaxID=3346293 RepID=UPI0036D964FB
MGTQDKHIDQEELLASETDILRGLLEAATAAQEETKTIQISRKGKVLFLFRIHPLSEAEYNDCREKATTYKKNKRMGGFRMPEDTDTARYRSNLIYQATVDEDRKSVWNNKAAWDQLNVLSGTQLIEKVLLPGEKDAVIEQIDKLSGYDLDEDDVEAVDIVKN